MLARRLIKLGYDCEVIAPSLIPTKPGEKCKTDRRDARKLAEMHRRADEKHLDGTDGSGRPGGEGA